MDLYLALAAQDRLPRPPSVQSLCFSWAAWDSLRKQGLPARAWEDYIPADLAPETREKIHFLARNWYRDEDRDPTLFQGVSLGDSYRYTAWIFDFQPACRFLIAFLAALKEHAPRTVYCETSLPELFRDVLIQVQKQRGSFRVEWVATPDRSAESIRWASLEVAPSPPKLFGYRLANWLSRLGRPREISRRPAIWMSYYHSLESVLEGITRTDHPFRYVLADLPGKHKLKSLISSSTRILWSTHTRPAWSPAQREALSELRRDWKQAQEKAAYREKFTFQDVDLWPAFRARLNARFETQLEPLAWACSRLERHWREDPPALVLLPADATPLQGLLVSLARRHDVPSVLVSHGLPMDYYHPLSDTTSSHLVVWGPEQKKLHLLHNTEAKQEVIVCGNPYFDKYASLRGGKAPSEMKKILVLSCGLDEFSMLSCRLDPERYITTLIPILLKAPELDVTVKLHPSESLDYYRALLAPYAGRLRIVQDSSIAAHLAQADLVIGSMTTVLMEAMLLDKPILCVNLTRKLYPSPFNEEWGLPPIKSAAEFESALERMRRDPGDFRRAAVKSYPRILERFAGPTDGSANARLLAELVRLSARRPCPPLPEKV
ncbi:MAG: hypothetical protein HY403_09565 [Elusimicrobia bacterium]|nr:hypothetical protein [Elusimicrobiota bacterium]